jgi:hypothetical protein
VRGSRRLAGAAVLVLLVASGVALALLVPRDTAPDAPNDQASLGSPDAVPRLVPAWLPPDVMVIDTQGLPMRELQGNSPASLLQLYGDPDASDPFRSGDLGIRFIPDSSYDPLAGSDPSVAVRGTQGRLSGAPGGRRPQSLRWREDDDMVVVVESWSLSHEELVTAADSIRFDDERRPLASALPAGMTVVGSDTVILPPAGGSVATPVGATGWLVGIGPPPGTGRDRGATVWSVAADESSLLALRWAALGEARSRIIRGREGYALPGDRADVTPEVVLAWLERPDVLVLVISRGIAAGDLERIVDSLEAATREEWDELGSRQR